MTTMQTASKARQDGQKKGRRVLPGAAQVYGRQTPEKATKIGRFKNAACTFVHVVVDPFLSVPEKAGRNGAT